MSTTCSAQGKIILTGEHAVVYGYPGIAVPVELFTTVTLTDDSPTLNIIFSGVKPGVNGEWYVRTIVKLCEKTLDAPVTGTVTIQNTVPLGKGMGSSTALVIAVCRCLLGEDCEVRAREIEDAVNPGNSGLDFAVIWHNRPVLFRKGQPTEFVSLPADILNNATLIDTGMPKETTPEMVAWVRERKETLQEPLRTIGHCTKRLLGGESLLTILPDHHRAQVALGVVTPEAQALIAEIEKAGGTAKVLGAGARTGGCGMVLKLPL